MIAILRTALERIADVSRTEAYPQSPSVIAAEALRAFAAAPGLEKDKELRGKLYAHLGSDRDTSKVLAIVTAHLRGAAK